MIVNYFEFMCGLFSIISKVGGVEQTESTLFIKFSLVDSRAAVELHRFLLASRLDSARSQALLRFNIIEYFRLKIFDQCFDKKEWVQLCFYDLIQTKFLSNFSVSLFKKKVSSHPNMKKVERIFFSHFRFEDKRNQKNYLEAMILL